MSDVSFLRLTRHMPPQLILASGSQARARLLRNAGVEFVVDPARIDEIAVRSALENEGASPRDVADTLADVKARRVAARNTHAVVLGADQVLACQGRVLSKPLSRHEVLEHLSFLRGKPHELLSALVVYEDGGPVWRMVGRVRLLMRNFSDQFLDDYVDRNIDSLYETVGCYKLEDAGIQLFEKIDGDYFTVLGLPLLPLLEFLRTRGVCRE